MHRAGNASSRLEEALARIAELDPALRAVSALDAEGARIAAAESDRRVAAGDMPRPLEGVLLGVKDNIAVAGQPWTAGLAGWRDRIADGDSGVVARLRAAGAIPLAMLNMHEGALGATTDNPHFGRTGNPHGPDHTPGGSSGGSAAAVAAGYVDAALGTDTMGSVRIPSAYCGVCGLKPTCGLVGRSGLAYLAPSLDTVGPIASSIDDIAAMIGVMAGPDAGDPDSLSAPPSWAGSFTGESGIAGLRVGIPLQCRTDATEAPVLAALDRVRAALEGAGCTVVEIDVDGWDVGRARRGGLLLTEAEGAVALKDLLDSPDKGVMSEGLRAMLDYGRALSSERLVDALTRIRQADAAFARAMAGLDAVLMPTAPQNAFPHGAPVPADQADFACIANFTGRPSLAVPVFDGNGGMPSSVQFLGSPFGEAVLLRLGRAVSGN